VRIATDWNQSPPTVLWRERVGPAWSSMAVVDGFVFTQEQRENREAIVCRDAMTGKETWAHEDAGRFEEAMSGVGPRATPTFAGGRIYALGALGTLDCLDAATGQLIWSRDVRKDADAALPIWAFSGSPLVMDDRVIVFAGGEGKKGLLAYSCSDGHPLWTADAGKMSYASPQAYDDAGGRRVLMFTNEGLFAVEPVMGQVRWTYPLKGPLGIPACIQACPVGPGSLVVGIGASFGTERIQLAADGGSPSRKWVTPRVKPSFSDMVFHDGFLYGFDKTYFCCVDAATGNRKWREGEYGAGQVLLLADQGFMIVTSEDGQAILLRCNADRNEELGRVHAVEGKTWNHPAVAGDRLYVRSDGEMVCLQLKRSD
jgi:outer membrane protein assembly factor BamB